MKEFAKRLRELREDREMKKVELAEELGLSYHTLTSYEKAHIKPSIDSLIKIAQFFKVRTDYLLGLED